ncbi:MAG: hypothetical protein JSU05_07350, partial [Bacteroidetes bacterium]|nr:hypothetical protein [Bacteroidota bacterium]
MKNIKYFSILLFSGLILTTSCKKSGESRNLVAPNVTTGAVSNIAGPSANADGNVTDDGGSIITEAGVCFDTISGVDITKKKAIAPHTFSGTYTASLVNLTMGKTYYYKAYAINEKGISYGDEKSFFAPFSVNGYTAAAQIAPANLIGHWSFENSLIDSVSSTIATGVGTSFANGVKGKALQGANNGYVISVPSSAVVSMTSFTISLWVNTPQNTTGTYGLVCLSNTNDFWGNLDFFFE